MHNPFDLKFSMHLSTERAWKLLPKSETGHLLKLEREDYGKDGQKNYTELKSSDGKVDLPCISCSTETVLCICTYPTGIED